MSTQPSDAAVSTRRCVALLARGETQATSDIDILSELEADAPIDLFGYAGLKRYVAELFPGASRRRGS